MNTTAVLVCLNVAACATCHMHWAGPKCFLARFVGDDSFQHLGIEDGCIADARGGVPEQLVNRTRAGGIH